MTYTEDQVRDLIHLAKAIGRRQAIKAYIAEHHTVDVDATTCRCGANISCPERQRLDTYLDNMVTGPPPTTLTTNG